MQLVWTDALLALGIVMALLDYFDLIDRTEEFMDEARRRLWQMIKETPRDEITTHPYLQTMFFVSVGGSLLWTNEWIEVPIVFFLMFFVWTPLPLYFFLTVWFVLFILDLPPRGTVASIGLLLVVFDLTLRFLEA